MAGQVILTIIHKCTLYDVSSAFLCSGSSAFKRMLHAGSIHLEVSRALTDKGLWSDPTVVALRT